MERRRETERGEEEKEEKNMEMLQLQGNVQSTEVSNKRSTKTNNDKEGYTSSSLLQ